MFERILIISCICLGVGFIAFQWLNRSSDKLKARSRNVKLFTYIFITALMYAGIAFLPWLLYLLAAFIVIISVREITHISALANRSSWIALLVALPVFYLFVLFIQKPQSPIQLFTYFIIINFDGFSQISGEVFGKHLLWPRVSPGKTWEGLLGGTLVASALGLLIWPYFPAGTTAFDILLFTVYIVLFGLAGDLLASGYKRICGVKDYSSLIPGHGGVLDRFDSFIMAGAGIQLAQWASRSWFHLPL